MHGDAASGISLSTHIPLNVGRYRGCRETRNLILLLDPEKFCCAPLSGSAVVGSSCISVRHSANTCYVCLFVGVASDKY